MAPRDTRTPDRARQPSESVRDHTSAALVRPALRHQGLPVEVKEKYAQVPLSFEANQGQSGPAVKFIARGHGYSLFLTSTGLAFSVQRDAPNAHRAISSDDADWENPEPPSRAVLSVKFAGARAGHVEGLEEQAGKSNYFFGNDPAKWRTNIPHFARVRYHGLYPGVDLVYYGDQARLDRDTVEPVAEGA